MSDATVVLTVLLLYAAAAATPGPNTLLISRFALRGERSAVWGAAFGMALAGTFYAILAMTGLSVLLERVGWLTRAVQVGGGLYLVYLGIQTWRFAGGMDLTQGAALPDAAARRADVVRGFRTGLVVDLANPKNIAFFVSLFAVAVPPDAALWAKGAILAGAFVIELLWYGAISQAFSTARARRLYARFGRIGERSVGAVLMVFGFRLASHRD